MDKAWSPSKLSTPPCEVEDYYNSDLSSPSLRQAFRAETKAESSKIVVMPILTIGANNLEEEMVTMKAMLQKHTKQSNEKEVCIKIQEEKDLQADKEIGNAGLAQSATKDLGSEEELKASIRTDTYDEVVHSKKDYKLKSD